MIVQNTESGEITDGRIRYVMIRADVLMGLAREWPESEVRTFVVALENSVFRHSRDSFEHYRSTNRFGDEDFLTKAAQVAAQLGWGHWRIERLDSVRRRIRVRSSPFAAGAGSSPHPVCGAICGVLRAIASVGYGHDVHVIEEQCAAQASGQECIFSLITK